MRLLGLHGAELMQGARMSSSSRLRIIVRGCDREYGACRLRISLSAAHTYEDVDALVAALHDSGVQFSKPQVHPAASMRADALPPEAEQDMRRARL